VVLGVFEGGFGKSGCLVWCFGGEVVVNCVVNRGWLTADFAGLKICHGFEIFLWKFAGCQVVAWHPEQRLTSD
jgi:hypothetical protein